MANAKVIWLSGVVNLYRFCMLCMLVRSDSIKSFNIMLAPLFVILYEAEGFLHIKSTDKESVIMMIDVLLKLLLYNFMFK